MANQRLPRSARRLFRLPMRGAERIAKDVDDELRFHVEMRAADLMASGLDADAANAEAWRIFGNPSEVREHAVAVKSPVMRRADRIAWFLGIAHDIRYALRQARRAPLFTLVAIMTLAVGIGANTAIYSVLHHLIVAPFPFVDSDRLVWITLVDRESNSLSLPDVQTVDAWRARAHSLEAISVVRASEVELRDGARVTVVNASVMSANLLPMLGVSPAIGRSFELDDERRGAPSVAMLGYEEWQTRFGGRLDIIGRVVRVDSMPRVIVGIAPAGFIAPFESETRSIWLPMNDSSGGGSVVARVRKGITIDAANKELTAIAMQLPSNRESPRQVVEAARLQDLWGWLRRGVLLLFASVGVVLLIAGANVANLLLVRASTRKREFAIRTALGAGRARLVRQLLTECLTIAFAGGIAGVALAWGLVRIFIMLRPQGLEVLDQVRIEPAALVWTTMIMLGTGLAFGLVPAVFATSRTMTHGLAASARDTEGRSGARVFRSTIIVAEIALSMMLLVGAGLLVRSFRAMENVDLGFASSGLRSASVRVGRATPQPQLRVKLATVMQLMHETPGIHDAVFATSLPPDIYANGDGLQPADHPVTSVPLIATTGFIAVQPGFFTTLGMHVRGRVFEASNVGQDSFPVNEIIINERLARRLWPGVDAVGRRVRVGTAINTVLGVANDLTIPGLSGDQFALQLYTSWVARDDAPPLIIFRTELDDRALAIALEKAIHGVDPQFSVMRVSTSDEHLRRLLAPTKFATALVSGFAMIALFLSVVGLYGIIAYAVNQRTREIGVRIALGAEPADIARLVLTRSAVLVGAGLLGGIALSTASTRLLVAYLYGVREHDPATIAGIMILLALVALLAAYLPARRAMRVDPVVALSSE